MAILFTGSLALCNLSLTGDVIKVLLAGCGATGHLALATAKVGAVAIATASATTTSMLTNAFVCSNIFRLCCGVLTCSSVLRAVVCGLGFFAEWCN